ncbi:MAG: hypothetical protein ISR77_18135 [Pirellulaceae bacterium]|nr:hypothetical protein [Pirellulaceae bacterium]
MRAFSSVGLGIALGCLLLIPGVARSQDTVMVNGQPAVLLSEASYENLMDRLDTIEASLGEVCDDGWEDISDEGWSHKVGGGISADCVMYAAQNAGSLAKVANAQNYFEYRFLRMSVAGQGYGVYDYKIEFDFEPENDGREGVVVRNVYFGIHEVPILGHVRFGNFRAPFGLEWSTAYRYLTFMERSLLGIFPAAWKTGVAAFNHSADENLTWAFGAFFEDIDQVRKERIGDAQGTIALARATYTPYYDEPSEGRYLIHTGIGYQYVDDRDDLATFSVRPEVHESGSWLTTAPIAVDQYNVLGLEGALVWGPLSVQSQYMYVPVSGFDFHGFYVYGSWFLTGENRAYSRTSGCFTRVKPHTNFWFVRGAGLGCGAVELATRWSHLDLSGTGHADGGVQNDLTVGLNWHWNPYVRWTFNYIHSWTKYDNGDATAENDILGIRGQVDF